jgi:hypothetical protein
MSKPRGRKSAAPSSSDSGSQLPATSLQVLPVWLAILLNSRGMMRAAGFPARHDDRSRAALPSIVLPEECRETAHHVQAAPLKSAVRVKLAELPYELPAHHLLTRRTIDV